MRTLTRYVSHRARILIIMAKYPQIGFVKTRLGRWIGDEAAATLYRAFLADLAPRFVSQTEPLRFDICWVYVPDTSKFKDMIIQLQAESRLDDPSPKGVSDAQTFFAGYAGAGLLDQQIRQLKWAQSLGYQHAVIISTDTPHLQGATVENAFQLLEEYDVVLGPTEDGGYYLLGLRKHWEHLEQVTMSTNHVAEDITGNALSANLTIYRLENMLDVDDLDDLKAFIGLIRPLNGTPCPRTWCTLQALKLLSL
jgi:glycosyltransferase A (GT-A) superfamily protein (DUF2064 family)